MTVNITISGTSGGNSLADTVDIGDPNPGDDTDVQDFFIRHDATVNPITDCAWYATRYTGSSYLGSDPDADYTEILGWGDAATGGLTINQAPPVSWVVGTQFPTGDDQVFKNGFGDIDNQIMLDEDSIITGTPDGDKIPVAGEAHVQVRVQVPSTGVLAGYKAIQVVLAYSATS
jgi:hypothetical protein